jgi:bacterioferritin-associated ferredoxin
MVEEVMVEVTQDWLEATVSAMLEFWDNHTAADGDAFGKCVSLMRHQIQAHRIASNTSLQAELDEARARIAVLDGLEIIANDNPEYVCAGIPDEIVDAGISAINRADRDLENYTPCVTPDWDEGMICAAVFRSMLAAALAGKETP